MSHLSSSLSRSRRRVAMVIGLAAAALAFPPVPPAQAVTGGTINVYFHVIRFGLGVSNGDVTTTMINNQIAVLNNSFSRWGWQFKLVAVDRYTSSGSWYTMG